VTGVDIWQEVDLGGNSPEAIHANAKAAGADVRIKGPILLWGPVGWRFSATKPGHAQPQSKSSRCEGRGGA